MIGNHSEELNAVIRFSVALTVLEIYCISCISDTVSLEPFEIEKI